MQTFRRSTATAGRQLQRTSRQQVRQYADHGHSSAHASAGPQTESFGRGFYITIGLIPTSLALYKLSAQGTDEQPYFTRVINSYDSWRKDWQARNALHTEMIEQAARDKNLFLNSRGSKHIDLKFPETLNQGAPWNVPAGHGANIDHAIAKYQKESYEENERKLQALKDNNIPAEKPYERPAGSLAQYP